MSGDVSRAGHPHQPDRAVVEAVEAVRDRFGAVGLRDMIALAQRELVAAEEALRRLREDVDDVDDETHSS